MKILNFKMIFSGALILFYSNAFADCFLKVNLACLSYPSNIQWKPKSAADRAILLFSQQVQSNPQSCQLVADILRTECAGNFDAAKQPLQGVFIRSNRVAETFYSFNVDPNLSLAKSTMPIEFQNYFNGVENSVSPIISGADVLTQLPKSSVSTIMQAVTSNYDSLGFDVPCVAGRKQSICGLNLECKSKDSSTSKAVGGRIEISTDGASTAFCSSNDKFSAILAFYRANVDLAQGEVSRPQGYASDFAAFGSMPLMDQTNGWIQGLSIQKYGLNTVKAGICLATAGSMVAAGLKAESPGSKLGNRFDQLKAEDVALVRAAGSTTNTQNLKYQKYATHIDEMMRAGGLLKKFPNQLSSYKNFFNGSLEGDDVANYQNYQGYMIFFENDIIATKSLNQSVEAGYKYWIQGKQSPLLALMSSYGQPPRNSTSLVGHAVAGHAQSGSNIIIMDPWNVVTHLQYGDYRLPNAGSLIHAPSPGEIAQCKADAEAGCEAYATSCDNYWQPKTSQWGSVSCDPYGPKNYSMFGNGFLNLKSTAKASCFSYLCERKIIVADGTYRMLQHVGADPGYVGQARDGGKTAAYVKQMINAKRWPEVIDKNVLRKQLASPTTASPSTPSIFCEKGTKGEITVEGNKYTFFNPIPNLKAPVNGQTVYTSSTPVTAGCLGFTKKSSEGGYTQNMVGTFDVTCFNGNFGVTNNKCKPFDLDCSIEFGKGSRFPDYAPIGYNGSYIPDQGMCYPMECDPGFSFSDDNMRCECKMYDAVTGDSYPGTVENGSCTFKAENCPAGKILAANREVNSPLCVQFNTFFTIPPAGEPIPYHEEYQKLTDEWGTALTDLDPNSIYFLDGDGYLKFGTCTGGTFLKYIDDKPHCIANVNSTMLIINYILNK